MSTGTTCKTPSFHIKHFLVVKQRLKLETIAKERASRGTCTLFFFKGHLKLKMTARPTAFGIVQHFTILRPLKKYLLDRIIDGKILKKSFIKTWTSSCVAQNPVPIYLKWCQKTLASISLCTCGLFEASNSPPPPKKVPSNGKVNSEKETK